MRATLSVLATLAGVGFAAEAAYNVPANLHSGLRARVKDLDAEALQHAVAKHRRFIVLMHDGVDTATRAFQPWLFALANFVPHVPVGRVDLSLDRGSEVAEAFGVEAGALPKVKLFVRDNPKGKRIVDYAGPLDFDALLDWVRAAINNEEHELSRYGIEPEGSDEVPSAAGAPGGGGAPGSAMSKLPESVRRMAQTMVRETRLQRILRQHGGGKLELYDAMVSKKYAEIVKEEETDMGNKFAVQEANRRARDFVREQLMADAPVHVREEVEAEVSLGDAANQITGGGEGSGGDGGGKKKSSKKKKKAASPKVKQEL